MVLEEGAIVLNCENLGNLGSRNHRLNQTHILGEVPNKKISGSYSDCIKANVVSRKKYLGNVNWQEEIFNLEVEEVWKLFKNKLNECFYKFVPQKINLLG